MGAVEAVDGFGGLPHVDVEEALADGGFGFEAFFAGLADDEVVLGLGVGFAAAVGGDTPGDL